MVHSVCKYQNYLKCNGASLSLGVNEEVNRVRENERGWDALNENFNSPVHETVVESSL
jgi:hypothetical protein